MSKQVLAVLCLVLLLASFVSADTISNYTVPSSVPLNQPVTATGIFDGNAGKQGILCSFYFFDVQGSLVYHATDQYTNANGRFAMTGKTLTEPLFVRGQIYTLHSECGFATADANFVVGQKQDVVNINGFALYPEGAALDLKYWADNIWLIFELIAVFGVILIIIIAVAKSAI